MKGKRHKIPTAAQCFIINILTRNLTNIIIKLTTSHKSIINNMKKDTKQIQNDNNKLHTNTQSYITPKHILHPLHPQPTTTTPHNPKHENKTN